MNNLSDLKLVAIYLITALLITILEGPIFIPLLHRFKFGQPIRDEGPKSHMKKAGTPTMGGIMFITATVIIMIFRFKDLGSSIIALFALVAFGVIGFLDDSLKIIKKQNEGLKSIQKMLLLILVSILIGAYMVTNSDISTDIFIPFIGEYLTLSPLVFIIFTVVYFAAVTNAVNLTDGLDGLATTISILVITFFNLIALFTLKIDVVIFSSILIGALLGFLRLNSYPARIFMGDTGSLALGGAIGAIAMLLNLQIVLIIVGGVFVFETLSVIIQVFYYKKTKKRFFKMAPVHHHFEAIGWHETRIVSVFSIVTVVLCAIGFLII